MPAWTVPAGDKLRKGNGIRWSRQDGFRGSSGRNGQPTEAGRGGRVEKGRVARVRDPALVVFVRQLTGQGYSTGVSVAVKTSVSAVAVSVVACTGDTRT